MKRLESSVLDAYRGISTGTVGHFLEEGFLDWGIQCLFRPVKLVGQAITVSTPPTDNAILAEALEIARPGDVLVIGRQGDLRHAPWGGILSLAAQRIGLGGVVIDGAATDWREITELQFPVYCRHLSAITTRRQNIGGSVGEPVACGGMTVHTGDLIFGDEDGVIVVRPEHVTSVLERARAKEDQEERMRAALRSGKSLIEARASLGI
jgi:4-hydroxy-4-methyl-2-oxoglutarate aldolase